MSFSETVALVRKYNDICRFLDTEGFNAYVCVEPGKKPLLVIKAKVLNTSNWFRRSDPR